MQILSVLNEYIGLISTGCTVLGAIAVLWLTKNFYTKNEAEKDRIEIHARLARLEETHREHDLLLKNIPSKEDLNSLKISIEHLNGQIASQEVKTTDLNDRLDRMMSSINMLTEYHLKN